MALLCAPIAAGCASEAVSPSGGGAAAPVDIPEDQGRPEAAARAATADLELLSEPRETLGFGEPTTLSVRLTNRDGDPIDGAPVSFALMGRAQDASLEELEVKTDEDGRADNRLLGGEQVATFRVRISALGAGDLYVDVRVSNAGCGTLVVDVPYEGARAVDERSVSALAMMSCEQAERMAGDPMTTLPGAKGETPAEFLALPAAVDYAVMATAQGLDGTIVARGCVDEVRLDADDEVRIQVPFEDEPLLPEGDYRVTLSFDASAPGATLERVLRDAAELAILGAEPPVDTAVAEAGFLLDAMERALADDALSDGAGIGELAANLRDARALPPDEVTLEESLASQLELEGAGPRAARMRLAALVGERFGTVELHATMSIGELNGELPVQWALDSWKLPAPSEGASTLSIDASADSEDVMTVASFDAGGDALELASLSLPSGLGGLAAEALRFAAQDAEQELHALAGCEVLSLWLAGLSFDASSCDDDCVERVCGEALSTIVAASEIELSGLDESRPTLELSGTMEMGDDDGDLQVERMRGDDLSGSWAPAEGASPEDAAEALSAVATAEMEVGAGEAEAP